MGIQFNLVLTRILTDTVKELWWHCVILQFFLYELFLGNYLYFPNARRQSFYLSYFVTSRKDIHHSLISLCHLLL